jgi:hypothetical protein
MGDYDLIILAAIIGGFVLFYIFASSGLFGKGLQDALSPLKDIAKLGGETIKTGAGALGIVGGNQQIGEPCEKKKLACGAGLVCDGGVCAPGTAKIGERCTAGTTSLTAVDFMPVVAAASGSYSKKGGIECENGSGCVNNVCVAYPTEEGEKCYPGKIKCPSGLTCYPRTGWGKCFKDPAGYDEFCTNEDAFAKIGERTAIGAGVGAVGGAPGVAAGAVAGAVGGAIEGAVKAKGKNNIKCGPGLTCYIAHTTGGIEGKCKYDWASEGQFCLASGQRNKIKCKEGLTCWPRGSEGGKCYKNSGAKEGEVCMLKKKDDLDKNAPAIKCDDNLVCVDNKCVKDPSGAGDFCKPGTKAECPDGFTCWPRDGPGKCYKHKDQTLGGICITDTGPSDNRIECGKGLACLPRGVGKCVPKEAKKGDECISDHVKCGKGLKCKNKDSRGVGTCQ